MIHPQQFPHYPEHVPEELKDGRFWVCCGGDKVPLVPWETYRASSTDPSTWRYYKEAVAAMRAHPERYAGVGRAITEDDDYIGVDLDDVRDPSTGKLSSRATEILRALDSYSEVSPSGKGVKVWVKGHLERSHKKPGLEIYQRGRYFTITGSFLSQFPLTISWRPAEILDLVGQEFPVVARREAEPYDGPELELAEFLDGVEVLGSLPDGLGTKLAIVCPWVHQHSDGDRSGTRIGQRSDGGLWFHCDHAHCASRGWAEFRSEVRRVRTVLIRRSTTNPTKKVRFSRV